MKLQFIVLFSILLGVSLSCSSNDSIPKETRTFLMGTTPWPADFTVAEVDTSYAFINNHCDLVSHHFDDGIPYQEAFNSQPMPIDLQQDVQNRIARTASNKKILLSVSALNLTRFHKADYYPKSTVSDAVKSYWNGLPPNNSDVISAYVNYISWLIDSFNPTYVNYAVESNVATFPSLDFVAYKDFLSQVYPLLKNRYPNLPFFISFIVDETNEGFANANQLLPYTDYIGLSAYPYVTVSSSANGDTNPALFPSNYFEKFILMDDKPFCFSETGYMAENISIPAFNLNKTGNEAWQNAYLKTICNLSNTYNAKFIIWFCSKDYDAGIATLQSLNLYQDLFGLWKDTGLKDQNGKKRLSYDTWLDWMGKGKINN
jgi:hypothetical protein